jgi:predicted amidohydrolase YtcJ
MPSSLRFPDRARVAAAGLLALAALGASACASDAAPDHVYYNARIWTGDSAHPAATALAVRGDRIVAIGADSTVRALAGATTVQEDLGGRRMVPGFHDDHWHLPTRRTADLTGVRNEAEIVARLREFAATLAPGTWLTGRGWTQEIFARGTPSGRFLDAAFPDRPVILTDRDGHQALVNARALSEAAVSAETRDPLGGFIARDAKGVPTGLLSETAREIVGRHLPDPTADEVYAALRHELHRAAERGLTAIQLANALDATETAAFERALAEDSLIVRFRIAVPFDKHVTDSALRAYAALRDAHTGPLLRYGIAKGMLDGTVDAGTAAMLAPYAVVGGTGLPRFTPEELATTVAKYDSAGIQVELHAIGDRAIRMALDAYEATNRANGPRDRRDRIEHIEVPDPADIPRFAALGVIASTQAIFALPDATILTNYVRMLGPAREPHAMPFKSLDDAGAIQSFGSDYPVFPMDPLLGIHVAVTRTTPEGSPAGGWLPEQRIALDAALRHYTWGSAYAAFREREIGTLRAGMLADFVVLSEEIIGADDAAILRTKPVLTVMGGRAVFRRSAPD